MGTLLVQVHMYTEHQECLGEGSEKQNGNLKWNFPLNPPPLMDIISIHFLPPFFLAIESYLYETDFTPGPIKIHRFKVFFYNGLKY